MTQYHSSDIRNFAIVGHGSSGKTSIAEAILKLGGEINRMGTIEAGSTVSDYHEGEKERQISIHATPLHLEWAKTKFNIISIDNYSSGFKKNHIKSKRIKYIKGDTKNIFYLLSKKLKLIYLKEKAKDMDLLLRRLKI